MSNAYDQLLRNDETNEYDALLSRTSDNQLQQNRAALAPALSTNPDEFAKAVEVGRKAGLPADVVSRNFDEINRGVQLQSYDALLEQNPTLAKQIQNKDFARIAHDDLEHSSLIERAVKSVMSAGRATGEFATRATRSAASSVPSMSAGFYGALEAMAENGALVNPLIPGANEHVAQFMRWARSGQEDLTQRVQGDISGAGDVERAVYSGVQSGAKSLSVALITRNPSAVLAALTTDVFGHEYVQAREQKVAPGQALAFAATQAGVEYLTEKVPVSWFLKDLKDNTGFLKTLGHQLAADIPGEQVATLLQDLNDWAVVHPDRPFKDYLAERPGAAAETLIATVAGAGFTTSLGKAVDVAAQKLAGGADKAQAAADQGEALKKLGQLAAASKLLERAPATFQQFVQAAGEDGGLTDVFVDARIFADALKQSGVTAEQLAQTSATVASQLPEALAAGGDVRVPIGEYAAQLAPGPLGEKLLPHLRTSPEAMSMDEAKSFAQSAQAEFEKQAGEQLAQQDEETAFEQSASNVEAKILEQLTKAGRFNSNVNKAYAQLTRSFFETTAGRLGLTPEQLYEKFPLQIRSEALTGGQLEQAGTNFTPQTETPDFKKWFGESKVRDAQGAPLRVFHGTGAEAFSSFDTELAFFAADPGLADDYAMRYNGSGANVIPAYLSFQKPFEFDAKGALFSFISTEGLPASWLQGFPDKRYVSTDRLAKVVKRAGYDSLILRNLIDPVSGNPELEPENGAGMRPVDVYVAFKPAQIKSAAGNTGAFDPNDPDFLKQGDRGAFSPEAMTIGLFNSADLSTFLHEAGHFFLEAYSALAAEPNAPAEIKEDMQRVLDWFGVKDIATWRAMTLEQQREYHEQFARGFERYLFEGVAPSTGLRAVFQRFRSWLINVYKRVTALNVKLPDEIRSVMDRMVATNEQIKLAEAARNYTPLFQSAAAAGMTEQEWLDYQALGLKSTFDAQDDLQTKSLRNMRWLANAKSRVIKELQKTAEEKRRAVEREVAAEVAAEPIYRAKRFISKGQLEMEHPTSKQRDVLEIASQVGTKISMPALRRMYGEEANAPWRYIPSNAVTTHEGEGLHPDLLAQLFGFRSGDHFIRAYLEADPIKDVIEARTDQRTLERYGDITNQQELERAAEEAVHNEARAKFVALELRALDKAMNVRLATGETSRSGKPLTFNVLTRAAREFAQATVARKRIRHLSPAQFAAAEARASRKAQEAQAAGDLPRAAMEKRNQLVNTFAAQAAHEAVEDVEKGIAYLRKFAKDTTRKGLDIEYLDQIDSMLERFELKQVSLRRLNQRASLLSWVESQRAMGLDPVIDPALENEARRQNYRELTIEEFRGLIDSVKSIEHLGRLKKKLLTAKREQDLEAVTTAIADNIAQYAKQVIPVALEGESFISRVKSGVREYFAMHRKLSSMVRQMDGFKDGGVFWENLIQPMNEAGDKETTARAEATRKLSELFKPILDSGGFGAKLEIPAIGASLSRQGRLAIALNWGNEANRKRVMEGDNWNEAQVQAILETLTHDEWLFVQGVWDYLDTYWSEIAAKERRVSGVNAEKVAPLPIDTKFGQMRGGYYPIKYDPRRSTKAESDSIAEVMKQALQGAYARATTRRGHTKARMESVKRPIRKDVGVIFEHVQQVIHDLSWHEYLIDAQRLLADSKVDGAIRAHYGAEVLRIMRDTLKDIAIGDTPAQNIIERGLNHIRTGASVAGLGWNVMTSLLQPLGLTQSMVRIGPKYVGRGLAQMLGSAVRLENAAKTVYAKSPMMKLRGQTMQREVNEIRNRVADKQLTRMQESYFWLIQKAQLIADLPTWLGQYEKTMDQTGNETQAIALADQAVLDSQGGGQLKDLAAVQRGGPVWKLFTNFYSFFNTTFNLAAESYQRTNFRKTGDVGRLAADYLLLFTVPAVMAELMRHALTASFGGDDDDDKSLTEKIVRGQVAYMAGSLLGVRELSAAIQGYQGYTGPAGLRLFSELAKLIKQIEQGELDAALLKSLNNAAGIVFHYPAGQVQRSVEGTVALMEGDTNNPAALVAGPPK